MAVDSVAGVNNTAATNTPPRASSSDESKATLNYDSFLKLLIAQMKNQDPTDPVDASQQMSQLATFSSVEQAIKTNRHLESLIQENSLTQATSLIGKTITSADGKTSGIVASVAVNSDGLTATLEDGKKVIVQSGIIVGVTPADETETPAETDDGTGTDEAATDPTDSAGA